MAAVTMDLILSNAGDANFRAWGKAISDRFAAFGWAKTADTGQIDWATVLAPTSTNQIRGYEVWRMNDALQAQAPVFLKIEYGSSAAIMSGPSLWFTLGTGSNGTGGLTGQVGTRVVQYLYNEASTTTAYRCIFSGDAGRFNMCLGLTRDSSDHFLWINIERSKDAAGADTGEGVHRCGRAYNGQHSQFLPVSGPIPPNEGDIGCVGPGAGAGSTGADVMLYPVFPFNVKMLNPVRGAVGYVKSDITQDFQVQASIYGLNQTFYVVGHSVYGPMLRGTTTNNGLALRYE